MQKLMLFICGGLITVPLAACGAQGNFLDDVFAPYHRYREQMVVENKGQKPVTVRGSLAQNVDSDYCESSETTGEGTIAPGQSLNLDLSLRCRQGVPHPGLSVEMVKPYDIGVRDLKPEDYPKIVPGFTFYLMSFDKTVKLPVQVVAEAPYNASYANSWSLPSVDQPQVAWLKVRDGKVLGLYFSIPKGARVSDVAFDKSTGIRPVEYFIVREEGNYFVTAFFGHEGLPLYPQLQGEHTKITCDDSGCSSQGF